MERNDFTKEDFNSWMKFGLTSVPNFERAIATQFKLPEKAIKDYACGQSAPHQTVMERMIDWMEENFKRN